MSTNSDIGTAVRLFGTAVGLVVGAVATPVVGGLITVAANLGASAIEASDNGAPTNKLHSPATTSGRFITSPEDANTPIPGTAHPIVPQAGNVTINVGGNGQASAPVQTQQSVTVSGNGASIVSGFQQALGSFASILKNAREPSDQSAAPSPSLHQNDDGSGYYDSGAKGYTGKSTFYKSADESASKYDTDMASVSDDTAGADAGSFYASNGNSDIGGFDPFAPDIYVGNID